MPRPAPRVLLPMALLAACAPPPDGASPVDLTCPPLADEGPRVRAFPPLSAGESSVVFAGDVLLGDDGQGMLDQCGWGWSLSELGGLLQGDAVVGNHEGVLSLRAPATARFGQPADPAGAPTLAQHFTHLSLANNHTLDREIEGLDDMTEALDEHGVAWFGAGHDFAEAARAASLRIGGLTVDVVGAMYPATWQEDWAATDDDPGVVLLHEPFLGDALVSKADVVVLYAHWGTSYDPISDVMLDQQARAIDHGVDLIVGHGPHIPLQVDDGDVPTLWSIGNTAFATNGGFGEDDGYGLIVRLVVAGAAPDRLEFVPVRTNNKVVRFRTEPCPTDEAETVLARYLPAHAGIDAGVGTLAL